MQKMPNIKQIYKELNLIFWKEICTSLMQDKEVSLPIILELGELSKTQLRSSKAEDWLIMIREEFKEFRIFSTCYNYRGSNHLDYPKALEFNSLRHLCKKLKIDYKVTSKLKDMYMQTENELIKELLLSNPEYYSKYYNEWTGILESVVWLKNHLQSGDTILVRSIQTRLPTKFIEQNTTLFLKIWDKVFGFEKSIKEDMESRYGISLKKDFLIYTQRNNFDGEMILSLQKPIEKNILIVENRKMLKDIPTKFIPENAFILGGIGNAISRLCLLDWLKNKDIFYFGDLDEYGYNMLASLRKKLKNQKIESIHMDIDTLEKYKDFCAPTTAKHLKLLKEDEFLTKEEYSAYFFLRSNKLMLEQEKLY